MPRNTILVALATLFALACAPARTEHPYDLEKLCTANADCGPAPALGVVDADAEATREREFVDRQETARQQFIETSEKWFAAFAQKDEPAIDVREFADSPLVFHVKATEDQHERIAKAVDERLARMETQITAETRFLILTRDSEAVLPENIQKKLADCRTAATQPSAAIAIDSDLVQPIFDAIVKDAKATQTVAPRISTNNGQRAYILVATEHEYTADYERIGGQWEKQTGSYRDGLSLGLRCATDDHKKVDVSVDFQSARLLKMNAHLFAGADKERLTVEAPELEVRHIAGHSRVDAGQTLMFLVPTDAKAKTDADASAYLLLTPSLTG